MKVSDLDPAALAKCAHLLDGVRDIEIPAPTGWHVLVLQYIRPEKVGSIFLADQTRKEDEYQGRVGLVLALGPDAYADTVKFPNGPWCQVGDWVLWPPMESAATRFRYGKAVLALINDDRVLMRGVDPVQATTGA
jgi:hypothetical protein